MIWVRGSLGVMYLRWIIKQETRGGWVQAVLCKPGLPEWGSFYFFLLEYACFIILCWFLPYNEMNQLNVYVHLLPLGSPAPAPIGHHRMPSGAPYATQQLPAG